MCSLLCILLVLGLVGKTSAFGNEGSIHWGWALLLSVVLSTIIVFLLLVIAYYEKIKLNRNLDFRLAKINATIMKHNILLGLTDECVCLCSHAVLHFIYYNTDQCIGQIQNFLMRQQVAPNSIVQDTITLDLEAADDTVQLTPSKKDREKEEQNCAMTVIGTLGPESYQEEAELLILQFSSQYVRKLVTKKLGSPKHHRHMPRGYCLCQYVEKKVFKMEI
ncbi:transmembrane protein 268-like [Glandiceps talaboti]